MDNAGALQSIARAVNDSGLAVGFAGSHPAVWLNGSLVDLGAQGGLGGQAYAVNNSGQVLANLESNAYLWQDGVWQDLAGAGSYTEVCGNDINDAGQVVGYARDGSTSFGFVWENGRITDINGLIDYPYLRITGAYAISNVGQILATSFDVRNGDTRAVVLTPTPVPEPSCVLSLAWLLAGGVVVGRRKA